LERKVSPAFQIAIEINQKDKWFVHENIAQSVDFLLQKQTPYLQARIWDSNNKISIYQKVLEEKSLNPSFSRFSKRNSSWEVDSNGNMQNQTKKVVNKIHIYFYSVSINKVQQICKSFGFSPFFTKDIDKANAILALKSYVKENKKLKQIAKIKQIPIYTVKKNTAPQIAKTICQIIK